MKEILNNIILNLVDDKNAVKIKQIDNERNTIFEVNVAEKDMGKIIGRQGKMAKSIRVLMKAFAVREHKKVIVEFI